MKPLDESGPKLFIEIDDTVPYHAPHYSGGDGLFRFGEIGMTPSRIRVIVPAADMIWIVDQFEPRPSLRNGHWMTLYSWGNPRYFPALPQPERRYFDVAPRAKAFAARPRM